eukprot:TRINITY_DN7724_c0_g1_i1.p1 TRINITY_DN7724_c0_g1~~TRINITY_DN7724_c0_g1_i1.p1  ORF type:complete len:441 (+),score=120.22 TRINITY_DN7724_c0_g1_i1:308-1630(+)
MKYVGVSSEEKITNLREALRLKKADAFVVVALDEVAWLFNIRGNDVEFNPVVLSYALVTLDSATLYLDEHKITEEVREHVSHAAIKPYAQIYDDLKTLAQEDNVKVWIDPAKSTLAIKACLKECTLIEENSPLSIPKAIKSKVELDGLRNSSIRDSVALVNYFSWLEKEVVANAGKWTEVTAADKLHQFRGEQELYVSESFETISSVGPNGAVIHYAPKKDSCASLSPDALYLCDSGGQYKDGTTDVTRTMHFGEASPHERRCYTRVLQGHIDLARAVFPDGTSGHKLDIIARMPLWADGLDYCHGTGHGYGSYLNVHEGPTLISYRESTRGVYFSNPLKPNMTVTIEPGYYEDGKFGIRIENCVIVVKADTAHQFGGKEYYGFEPLTLVPMDLKLIVAEMLSREQKEWLNAYHARVRDTISPFVEGTALAWLMRNTEPI